MANSADILAQLINDGEATNFGYKFSESPSTQKYHSVAAQNNPDYAQAIGDIYRWGDINRGFFGSALDAESSKLKNAYLDKKQKEKWAREDKIRNQAKAEARNKLKSMMNYNLFKLKSNYSPIDVNHSTYNSANVNLNPKNMQDIQAYNDAVKNLDSFSFGNFDNEYDAALAYEQKLAELDQLKSAADSNYAKTFINPDREMQNKVGGLSAITGEETNRTVEPMEGYGGPSGAKVISQFVRNPVVKKYQRQKLDRLFNFHERLDPAQEKKLQNLEKTMGNLNLGFINDNWNSDVGAQIKNAIASIDPRADFSRTHLLTNANGDYFIFDDETGEMFKLRDDLTSLDKISSADASSVSDWLKYGGDQAASAIGTGFSAAKNKLSELFK